MYDRVLDGKQFTFVVSGLLWNNSLVMKDLETKSLWSHLWGKSMEGEMQDSQLKTIPSLLTTWDKWKALHPNSTSLILDRTSRKFTSHLYRDPADFLVGWTNMKQSRAWRFSDLAVQPLVNDAIADEKILVWYHKETGTPFLFDRQVDEQVLTFQPQEPAGSESNKQPHRATDVETGSTWDLQSGTALAGSLQGKRLKPLVGIPSFISAWEVFHPNSEYWQPE